MALESIGDIGDQSLTENVITEDVSRSQMLSRRGNDYRARVIEDNGPTFASTAQYLDRRNHGNQTEVRP